MIPSAADQPSRRRAGSGASLKPEDGELDRDLIEFERTAQAERLARLAADHDLIQTLQWLSFNPDTDEWKKLQAALIEYGWSVFTGWFVTGVAVHKAKARRIRGMNKLPDILKLEHEHAQSLAVDLMVTAVETFRVNVLCRNRWDSSRGATLKTFFIGHCLFQFPDVYLRWRRDEASLEACAEAQRDLTQRGIRADAGKRAIDAVYAEEVLGSMSSETRAMFELQVKGYSYDEIADMLEVSESVVRTNMSRARAGARLEKSA